MHVTQIVKATQVSDEAVAVTVRCCDNPKSDSTVTIYGIHEMTPETLQAKVDKHYSRVAKKCHGMGAGQSLLATLSKMPKAHEVI
jgi:hypothetical protein